MLQDRAASQRPSPQAPPPVLRRARRRQASTVLVSAVTALAVIGGTVLGLQALGKGKPPPDQPAAVSSGDTRSVTVSGYAVTYPADWALQAVTVVPDVVGPG